MTAKATCSIRTYQLTLFLACLLFSNNLLANDAPPEIFQAAQSGLEQFVKQIPENALESYGFSQKSLLGHASLGKPINLYEILPSDILNYDQGMGVESLITATGMWYFPVVTNDRMACFLIVDRVDNAWEAVSLGNAALAAQLSNIIEFLPESHGDALKLVCSFQAGEYLFSLPQKGPYNLTSLKPQTLAIRATSKKETPLFLEDISNTLNRLKPIIENNINNIWR